MTNFIRINGTITEMHNRARMCFSGPINKRRRKDHLYQPNQCQRNRKENLNHSF